jgi:hypothetical protein
MYFLFYFTELLFNTIVFFSTDISMNSYEMKDPKRLKKSKESGRMKLVNLKE